eukprot:10090036-Alexandrium_andersonii.AAC.1
MVVANSDVLVPLFLLRYQPPVDVRADVRRPGLCVCALLVACLVRASACGCYGPLCAFFHHD